ncbi:MAG TPA: VOC family protein [Polyangiaceae bacterium]|nr:VOC family protein [Polyangiaceae bacterium]
MSDATAEGPELVSHHLVVSDGARAIVFYRRALGAVELYRLCTRQGKIAHAELTIGGSRLTLSDEAPERGARSARSLGGCSMQLGVYARDVETLARNFLGAGGFLVQALQDQPQGERSGQFRDPEGYQWTLAERREEVSLELLEQRINGLGLSLWRPRATEPRRGKPPSVR